MLEENFAGEVHLLVKTRAAFLMKWTTRCKELEGKEKLLHESLEPHLRGFVREAASYFSGNVGRAWVPGQTSG